MQPTAFLLLVRMLQDTYKYERLDILPLFAKAGAIIPLRPAMKHVGEKQVDVITFDFFPGMLSSFDLYEDDGKSLSYQQNELSNAGK